MECPKLWLNSCYEHKDHIQKNIQKNYHFLSKLTPVMFMQSVHWSGNYWLESTPSYEFATQQKHDHFQF